MTGFADADDPDTIRIPFIFVPHGAPMPTEWLRDHPEAFRVPATMVWRQNEDGEQTAAIAVDLESSFLSATFDGSPPSDGAANPIQLAQARTLLQRGLPPPPPVRLAPRPAPPRAPDPSEPGWADWAVRTFLHLVLPGLPPLSPGDRFGLGVLEANPKPDRNAGLPGPLRAYSYRARKSAEAADAATDRILDPDERDVHHLVNLAATGSHGDLLTAAVRTGWFLDETRQRHLTPRKRSCSSKARCQGYFPAYPRQFASSME